MTIPHEFPFDPRYGHSVEDLRHVRPEISEPDDLEVFWRELRAKAEGVALDIQIKELPCPREGFALLEIFYSVWPDYRIGGWAIVPEDRSGIRSGMVVGHGYGGREEIDWGGERPDRILFFPVAPGFQMSADPRLPLNDSWKHVVHGIEDPQTYVLGSCAAALWRSVDVVEELAIKSGIPVHYVGWSFGGGMGALMLPWEPRYASAELGQPTFGWHDFRLHNPCQGSGEAVRLRYLEQPDIRKTLSYFDAASAIQRVSIPVVFGCSVFDPCVQPPGQFAVANSHPGPKRISEFSTGHFDFVHSGQEAEDRTHRQNVKELFPGL